MKKIYCLLTVLCGVLVMTGCKNGETYSDLKEAERDAINRYIQNENIKVISQAEFTKQGETTDVSMNEFVYLDKSGVYMQIDNNQRYDYSSAPDKMSVERLGSSFSGSFVSGAMYTFHGSASVPSGWMVPLAYVNLGRWADGEIAKVCLIVPHSQGTVDASSSVYPCYYEITYERAN